MVNHLNKFILPTILLSILYLFVAPKVFWADSEMWSVTSAFHLFGDYGHDHSLKPLFDLILYSITHTGHYFNVNIMDISRSFMALVMIFNFALFYFFAKKNKISNYSILLTLLILMSLSLFWERSMRVRSDFLVLTFHLLSLNVLFMNFSKRVKVIFCFILFVAAYFISPKSLIISFAIVFCFKIKTIQFKLKFLAPAVLLVAFGLLFFILKSAPAFEYFLNSFTGSEQGLSYFNLQRFEHVYRVLLKNIWLLPVLLIGFYASITNFKKKPLAKFQVCIFLYLFLFPNKLPFFILSLLLFLILPGVNYLENLMGSDAKSLALKKGVIGFIFPIILYQAYIVVAKHNNIEQKFVQKQLCDQLAKFKKAKVFDPIGVCPYRSNSYFRFLGPYHNNENELDMLKILMPDILLGVAKFQYLFPGVNDLLMSKYKYNSSGIFYKVDVIDLQKSAMSTKKLNYLIKEKYGQEASGLSKKYVFKDSNGEKNSKRTSLKKPINLKNVQRIELTPYNLESVKLNKKLHQIFRYDSEI